ncbi:efflux RND transporter permease subunit [Gillisia limnaea]|uniref:Transporter, hydrophobe/amphiphile efflux-1 (HAE1) family n=1 Tax=Gillisia limnaea (strain DSM 15749 / LMG 21470 / R-8282) TaxID=865937 RepID=H2BT30_GILLR|nr:efflux RND transporter permease subunit [Gillisia limnaea]EHQ02588.1 transporter, hydrophobe/amphiphile efflux-1 (HAE1) family [Gillisia limnaea DSM 15749]
MLKIFIERPVLSTVVSILLLILGILSLSSLPVTQYPDIAPPTVQVSAGYPGANAQTILESVVIPIEEQINGVEGMTYITSTASNDGSAGIQVFFEQDTDPDIAAVNVQNRVSRANALLPQAVVQNGIIVQKQQTSALMYFSLFSENEDYDATFLENYMNINIIPELQRINGVGEARSFGGRNYAMRIWLLPEKMAAYNLVPSDVTAAINEQSLEAAAGSLGQNSGQNFEYVLRYKGRYKTAEEYKNIIIKAQDNGQILRLQDVANVELDAQGYSSKILVNGLPGINVGVFQTPGSNAQAIIENIQEKLDELKEDFPEGVDYFINYNTNDFLTASIDKVTITLIEAFLLVFLVVFVFLQDVKATVIPAIAVPVSIIGTFFFLNLFGYSINLLTLFALVLAIGIVVDDAIVVVEAVYANIEAGAKTAKEASITAMDEIGGAIISITLVMAAVFVPVTFLSGPTGVFYQQFGVTLIVAVTISAVVALTLSPALCAIFLKSQKEKEEQSKKNLLQKFYSGFNNTYAAASKRYVRSVSFLTRNKWITGAILVAAILLTLWAAKSTPTGFVPTEDRGIIFMNLELPVGASLDRTSEVTENLYNEIIKLPGVRGASMINGRNFFSGAGGSYALGFIPLQAWNDREDEDVSIEAITAKLTQLAITVAPDAKVIFFQPPSIPGFGSSEGFEARLLDRTGGSFEDLDEMAKEFTGSLIQQDEIAFASNSFSTDFPQYQIDIDIATAKKSGVSVNEILSALQGYVGGIYAADFSRFGKQYRVYVQSLPEDRADPGDLSKIFVRNSTGQMAPINQFITLNKVYGPQSVSRFNLFNSVTINGSAAPGSSSGEAIAKVEELSNTSLPQGYDIAYSGLTREEIAAGGQASTIFILSLVFVFFLLAAQYESFLVPFSVLLTLPVGIMGAFLTIKMAGLENNIFFQIALIMLLGLLAKNAILIVEFAIQRRKTGMGITEAAVDAAKVRLRPILMTSFAFILGLMPLVLASGVGAIGNRSIGTGAVGGLLVGTILGVFITPVLFIIFQTLQEKISGKPVVENKSLQNE